MEKPIININKYIVPSHNAKLKKFFRVDPELQEHIIVIIFPLQLRKDIKKILRTDIDKIFKMYNFSVISKNNQMLQINKGKMKLYTSIKVSTNI